MSKKINEQILTLSPPMFLDETGCEERVISKGHRCSKCNGKGVIDTTSCPVCKGKGVLDAVITIKWSSI